MEGMAWRRMTQCEEALTGKIHAQELPGRPFPQPTALTHTPSRNVTDRSRRAQDKGVPRQIPNPVPKHVVPGTQGGPSPHLCPLRAGGLAPHVYSKRGGEDTSRASPSPR